MPLHERHGAVAVADGEDPEHQVTSAAPDGDGSRELPNPNPRHAGEQHEHFEGAGGGSIEGIRTAMIPWR